MSDVSDILAKAALALRDINRHELADIITLLASRRSSWGQGFTNNYFHVIFTVPAPIADIGAGCGPSGDRTRWIGCPRWLFSAGKGCCRVVASLLSRLQAAFDAGQLRFFGDLASLVMPAIFALRACGRCGPFAGSDSDPIGRQRCRTLACARTPQARCSSPCWLNSR
jgi:hypothetical protein